MILNNDALNEAMWAACNTKFDEDCVPSMEKVSEAAINAVKAYVSYTENIPLEFVRVKWDGPTI